MSAEDRARLIDDVLSRLPARERRSVMGEAIRNAGTLNLPPDDESFLRFVRGPFARAATSVLEGDDAEEVVNEIVARVEAAAAKSSTLPYGSEEESRARTAELEARLAAAEKSRESSSNESTLPYGAPAADAIVVDPVTLALVEPDSGFREALVELLRARGHDVHVADGLKGVVALAADYALEAVVANLDPGGYSFAGDLRRALGRATPSLVLLGGTLSLHAPRPGVARVLPKQLDVAVAEAIEELVNGT